jgi:hypothetical protein
MRRLTFASWDKIESVSLMFQSRRVRLSLRTFCVGMIALHVLVWWMARRQVAEGLPDFRIFYTAGLMLRRGQGTSLYNDSLQLNTQREFVPPARFDDTPLPYNHPPFEALLYLPLTSLSYLPAYFLWDVLNLGLLVATIWRLRPWLPNLSAEFPRLLYLVPLAFFPVAYALMQGQDSIMLMALYGLAYGCLRRGRDLEAGACLGLGLFKFHLVLPFAFILLLRRRWQAIAGLAAVALGEAAVSWALVGWEQLRYYPTYAWRINRLQHIRIIVPSNMPNLRGLLTGWKWSAPARPWPEIALLGVSVALLVWAARQWQAASLMDEHRWNRGFSIALIVTFLTGYHGYNQDLSILLVPLLLTADFVLGAGRDRATTTTKLFLGLMFFSPLYLALTLQYDRQNLFSLVPLSLAGCLAWLSRERPPVSEDKSTEPSIALLG